MKKYQKDLNMVLKVVSSLLLEYKNPSDWKGMDTGSLISFSVVLANVKKRRFRWFRCATKRPIVFLVIVKDVTDYYNYKGKKGASCLLGVLSNATWH